MTKGNVAAQKSSQVCALHFLPSLLPSRIILTASCSWRPQGSITSTQMCWIHLNTGSTAGVGHAELICLDILYILILLHPPPKKGHGQIITVIKVQSHPQMTRGQSPWFPNQNHPHPRGSNHALVWLCSWVNVPGTFLGGRIGRLYLSVWHCLPLKKVKLNHVGMLSPVQVCSASKVRTPKIRTLCFSLHPLTLCLGQSQRYAWRCLKTMCPLMSTDVHCVRGTADLTSRLCAGYGKIWQGQWVLQQDATSSCSILQQADSHWIPWSVCYARVMGYLVAYYIYVTF